MKRLARLVLALALFSITPLIAAESWSLAPCVASEEKASSRVEYLEAVREAKPDTPLYTPHPLPQTDRQVFEIFVEFHSRVFADTDLANLPSPEAALLQALRKNGVEYEVFRVENWTPLRCGARKAKRYWSVLRIFDGKSGIELARASVDEVGHVGKLGFAPANGEGLEDILSLSESLSLMRRAAPSPIQAQYVATWGTLRCDALSPCVAMRDGDSVYLQHPRDEHFYLVAAAAKRFSFKEDVSFGGRRENTLEKTAQSGKLLVSLGADLFSEAQLLPVLGD